MSEGTHTDGAAMAPRRPPGGKKMPRTKALLLTVLMLLFARPGFSVEINYSLQCDAFATASIGALGDLVGNPEDIRDGKEATALVFSGSTVPSGAFWNGVAEVHLGRAVPNITRVEIVHGLPGIGGGTWELFLRVGAVWQSILVGFSNFDSTTDVVTLLATNVSGAKVVARGGNGITAPSNYQLFELRVIGPQTSFLCNEQTLGFFGLKSCGLDTDSCSGLGNSSRDPTTLYSFVPGASEVTDHGIVRVGLGRADVDGLAFSPVHGLLAFELVDSDQGSPSGSRLVHIAPIGAGATALGGVLPGRNIRGAAFDAEGQLWAVDANADELLIIDPVSGNPVGAAIPLLLGGSPFNLGEMCDIAFRRDGLLTLTHGSATLYALNVQTGELTEVFQDDQADDEIGSLPTHAGIAFSPLSPFDLYAYDVRQREDIFLYETEQGVTRTEVYSDIIPDYNAGLGDLASQTRGCAELPQPVSGLQLEAVDGGIRLQLQWSDDASADGYVIFHDGDGAGPFFHLTGSAVSGSPGLTIQMPEDDIYFLVAGDNPCGIGPKH